VNFYLKFNIQQTLVPPELLEIYQPMLGFEAISVWINIYHALLNQHTISETDLLQQMNITRKSLRNSIAELKNYGLLEVGNDEITVVPPMTVADFSEFINDGSFSPESKRRFTTLIESFQMKRGQKIYTELVPVAASSEPGQASSHELSDQQADEFTTRFIKECNFVPNKQLRERFDMWFDQIRDSRLLEELLERTKRKVQMEGGKGSCPSLYTDKIVRQWLVQGIKTYEDLLRNDQEFHARWEYYRIVEKELGRSFNSLTPAEKEIIDRWIDSNNDINELKGNLKKAILSGDYQGKGAPGIVFIDEWLNRQGTKKTKQKTKSAPFTHQHKSSDLEEAIKRKTKVGLEDANYEG
jgi:DNA replication protein DnaD